ncbi:MAG: hypothetical protein EPN91_07245 [Salinibacterium sp.]|nr:MAG: hypothetical protein EPN91_07245 [Salinibacterium sp.]
MPAASLESLSEDWAVRVLMDPRQNTDEVVKILKAHWSYDLYSRSPGPALLQNGVLSPTDLDLACFMSALVDRKAVINLPRYQARRPVQQREGEVVLSKDNRHGKCLGLSANKDVFSFSVRIWDVNVMTHGEGQEDQIGAFRNYMMVDLNGQWWEGWDRIEFVPQAKENQFLEDKKLWTGNTVYFKNFVHPNRWQSFYGKWYFVTKLCIDRLTAEAAFLRAEAKRMKEGGTKGPEGKEVGPSESANVTKGASRREEVTAFEAVVDMPFNDWKFEALENTPENLVMAYERAKLLSFTEIPKLRFATRATELAYSNQLKKMGTEPMAAWVKDLTWERGYKEGPRSRTLWNRMIINQPFPFVQSVALRYRTYTKTEEVAA